MGSSLFHLNHLAFQCSNSSSQVCTCCLHHGQYCSSERGHSCAHKDSISFSKKQGYQCCRRLLCSGYPAGRCQEVVEDLPHKHSQLETPGALLPATKGDTPVAGLLRLVLPTRHQTRTTSKKIRLRRGTSNNKILTHLSFPFSATQSR